MGVGVLFCLLKYQWMSELVEVAHDGQALGGSNPGRACVKKFFDRVDKLKKSGKPWYPGASLTKRTGRPVELSCHKRMTIANSMMAAKQRGDLPCYDLALARCPAATLNETTGKPFSRRSINKLLNQNATMRTQSTHRSSGLAESGVPSRMTRALNAWNGHDACSKRRKVRLGSS